MVQRELRFANEFNNFKNKQERQIPKNAISAWKRFRNLFFGFAF